MPGFLSNYVEIKMYECFCLHFGAEAFDESKHFLFDCLTMNEQSEPSHVFSVFLEGPCLIHSMNGDLLRTLEGPDSCLQPRLIQSSSEGHCVVYYEKGHFCLFSVNGKLLGHMEVEDSIKVRKRPFLL